MDSFRGGGDPTDDSGSFCCGSSLSDACLLPENSWAGTPRVVLGTEWVAGTLFLRWRLFLRYIWPLLFVTSTDREVRFLDTVASGQILDPATRGSIRTISPTSNGFKSLLRGTLFWPCSLRSSFNLACLSGSLYPGLRALSVTGIMLCVLLSK